MAEPSHHEADGGEFEEGKRAAVEIFPILGKAAAPIEPGQSALDHPSAGKSDEAFDGVRAFDDLDFKARQDPGHGTAKDRPAIGAVGKQFLQEWKHSEQGRQQKDAAVTILNISSGDDTVQEQALRIDEDMPLLALDLFARIEPRRVDAGPPFSALLTLWLSITQPVGLASRSIFSRHFTYRT